MNYLYICVKQEYYFIKINDYCDRYILKLKMKFLYKLLYNYGCQFEDSFIPRIKYVCDLLN